MSGLHDVVVTRSGDATLSGEQLETYSSKNASHGQAVVLAGGMLAGGGPTGGPFLVEEVGREGRGLVGGVEQEDGVEVAVLVLEAIGLGSFYELPPLANEQLAPLNPF